MKLLMKKNKKKIKEKIISILKSYKTIIFLSFIINIVLLIFSYNLLTSNHEYTFGGRDEYISIKDGLIVLNNDLNLIYGNNIKYINEEDYEITTLTMGYYVLDSKKELKKVINKTYSFEEGINLSEIINKFTNFNLVEKNKESYIFTDENVKQLDNGLYFILKAKTVDNNDLECKINLNIKKISKF